MAKKYTGPITELEVIDKVIEAAGARGFDTLNVECLRKFAEKCTEANAEDKLSRARLRQIIERVCSLAYNRKLSLTDSSDYLEGLLHDTFEQIYTINL